MKNLKIICSLLLFVFFMCLKMGAQQESGDSVRVITISPEIGQVIDLNEKLKYSLFSYFSNSTFAYASVYEKNNDSSIFFMYFVIAHFNDSSVVRKELKEEEITIMQRLTNKDYGKKLKVKKKSEFNDSIFVKLRKNIVSASFSPIPFLPSAEGNYERIVVERNKRYFRCFGLRVSGGVWAGWEAGGKYAAASITGIWGYRKHHIDADIGVLFRYDTKDPEEKTLHKGPCFSVGYRYQKPGGHFVFRTGLYAPNVAYLAFGVAF